MALLVLGLDLLAIARGFACGLALVCRRPPPVASDLCFEELDAADLTASTINRSNLLNSRPALAAAASAVSLALPFAADILARFRRLRAFEQGSRPIRRQRLRRSARDRRGRLVL